MGGAGENGGQTRIYERLVPKRYYMRYMRSVPIIYVQHT